MKQSPTPLLVQLAPMIFVFLWATGFVGAKYGMEDAEPFTFLAVRFVITSAILMFAVYLAGKLKRSDLPQLGQSLLIGCLIHGAYLGGVFYAIDRGLAAGISSLVVALQPFLTAVIAWVLMGERLSAAKSLCFLAALAGVFLVLFPKLDLETTLPGVTAETVFACLLGTFGISLGSVYQKRVVNTLDLWASTGAQFVGAALLMTVLALFFETGGIRFTGQLVLVMVWLVLVLSIGAVALLMFLIRRGDTASVASLFYLVPVVAMFTTWILFDERLVAMQLLGSAIVVASVGIASRLK